MISDIFSAGNFDVRASLTHSFSDIVNGFGNACSCVCTAFWQLLSHVFVKYLAMLSPVFCSVCCCVCGLYNILAVPAPVLVQSFSNACAAPVLCFANACSCACAKS